MATSTEIDDVADFLVQVLVRCVRLMGSPEIVVPQVCVADVLAVLGDPRRLLSVLSRKVALDD